MMQCVCERCVEINVFDYNIAVRQRAVTDASTCRRRSEEFLESAD